MAYAIDLEKSASRHYDDGCTLFDSKRFDNAGYHFGLAAECAIKQQLQNCGVSVGDAAMWEHFPEMRNLALQALSGRAAAPLMTLLGRDSFMQFWHVKMRYAPNGAIAQDRAERRRKDANLAIGLLLQ